MPYATAALLLILAALCIRSLTTGRGWPARILLRIYYGIGSLEAYQKTGRTYRTAMDAVAAGGEPFLGALLRRIAPRQVGWFSPRMPTDKGTCHDYLPIYDGLFAPYRDLKGIWLLEIGVKKGGSLVLWRELFDESAFIYGIDINPDVPKFTRDGHIKVLILDSRNASAVDAALRDIRFDIIIDDGFHHLDAQLRTFAALRSHLKPTGVYVIEDVYETNVDRYLELGMHVTIHPDRSGQCLVVLYPRASLALATNLDQLKNFLALRR